jgi:predicted nucleotidyltransferase component of viral defense system
MIGQIPINLKLKRKIEKDIAYAQDVIVEELYNSIPDAVLHGGTAIWRCYSGNRFSEDIDAYIKKDIEKIDKFLESLQKKGFKIVKKRIKENSFYSELLFQNTPVRFEATFQNKRPTLKAYETSESSFINVNTLLPEELIIEKISAYLNRLKIRDLYDIYFLLNFVEDRKKVEIELRKFLTEFKYPKDEKDLTYIIISGAVPTSNQLYESIKRWAR